ALGIRDFAAVDSFRTRRGDAEAAAAAREITGRNLTFSETLELDYRGAQVGRHVLSSMIGKLRGGSLPFSDPQVRRLLHSGLQKALRYVHGVERLLDEVRPDLVLLLERGHVPFGEFFDLAINRGIPVIQYCHPHRKDALLLKRYSAADRYDHPWSLSAATWEQVRHMPWSPEIEADLMHEMRGRYAAGTWFDRKFLQSGKCDKSPDEVRQQLGLDPAKKTAVVFSHVLWDATFFYGTSLFDDYEHWLVETVKAACRNDRVNWVIKLHPDYVWKMKLLGDTGRPPEYAALEAKVGPLPPHVRILAPQTDISTWSLFALTDWCITVRGTIGIEMSCFGIPVMTAGTGRYAGLGFTLDSSSRSQYLERLAQVEHIPPLSPEQIDLARRHAYAVFRLRPIPFTSFAMDHGQLESLGQTLDQNVSLAVRSASEFAGAADLRSFREWAAHSDAVELMLPCSSTPVARAA
ncbi:MAG: hypothetical protein AB7F89_15945, partial [Pirellulaceae bacterium]